MTDDDPRVVVPDDLSTLPELTDESEQQLWVVDERLVLTDGTELTRMVAELTYEPHLGNLGTAMNAAYQTLHCHPPYQIVRFRPDGESLFFTPIGNVRGVYIDVIAPDGSMIPGNEIKSGTAPTDPDSPPTCC